MLATMVLVKRTQAQGTSRSPGAPAACGILWTPQVITTAATLEDLKHNHGVMLDRNTMWNIVTSKSALR